jgi:7-cyano-7-deazaguanine synthase
MKKKAVILLSGGVDSSTVLAIAQHDFECYALSINYGQKHNAELKAAQVIAQKAKVQHQTIDLNIQKILRSALTNENISVPDYIPQGEKPHIPSTYVPARNTMMLSMALAWAESLDATDIFYGANSLDYSGYPDCRIEYVHSFETMANLATKAGVEALENGSALIRIHTPIIHLNKAQIIELGVSLGVDFSKTVSCYQANHEGKACGRCDACILRKKGFEVAGIADPTLYYQNI